MDNHILLTVAILLASVCALSAQDIHQPSTAPSTASNLGDDTLQSILLSQDVQGALGKDVRSSTGENLGRIVDILVDRGGQVCGAVIDFGGLLGVCRKPVDRFSVIVSANTEFAASTSQSRKRSALCDVTAKIQCG